MEHADKLKARETILAKQREFLDALSSVFSNEFRRTWIPLAETCYQHLRKVAEEKKKADLLGQALKFRSGWMQDLRIKLLHDLARYIQANQSEFDGNAQRWMQERLTEIWSPAFTEEAYLEWLAAACDDTTNLESWRAPSWLPAALGFPEMKIRFEETDGVRLDLESTDELIRRDFKTEYLRNLLMGGFSEVEREKIVQLQVFIYQGFKIPPGLHDNQEESLLSVISRQLKSEFKDGKRKSTGKLPPKNESMSRYVDCAKFTSLQYEVMSLKYEYGLKVPEIAERLGKHRKTIADHIAAAEKKLQEDSSIQRKAKLRAAKLSSDRD
jgi:predicted DNA-binding protein (UPF0251 family)